MIQIFSNSLGKEELQVVQKLFESKWVGKGKECEKFENELGRFFNVNKILFLNNCTSAIYLALRTLGIKKGDEVIIATVNFVACANAVIDIGAKPVFADVDEKTLNILPSEIERLKNSKTKAVIILHYGGHPANLDNITNICRNNDIKLIEDSANSIYSNYHGKKCGTFGDAGVWSFDAMKILVTIDGGALYLKDADLMNMATSYRYLGLAPKTTSGIDALSEENNRWWEFELMSTAGRFVSNDVFASIGRIQLNKLHSFINRRKQIWGLYKEELQNISWLELPPEPLQNTTSTYYLFWLKINNCLRDKFAKYMVENGIYVTYRYFPLHLVKYYKADVMLPNAEKINEETINIPLHQNLNDKEVEFIISKIKRFKYQ